jgi:hypothetical protein
MRAREFRRDGTADTTAGAGDNRCALQEIRCERAYRR